MKTIEMKSEELYRANMWVFNNPVGWWIIEGQTYPYLQMKQQSGSPDLNGDARVDLEDFVLFSSQWMAIIPCTIRQSNLTCTWSEGYISSE